jgi:hypothetical protein
MEIPNTSNLKEACWATANRNVLWGWKRDSGAQQRIVLFGALIGIGAAGRLRLDEWFLFYRTRSHTRSILNIGEVLNNEEIKKHLDGPVTWKCPRTNLEIVEISGGPGSAKYKLLVRRLLNRRPRRHVPIGSFPPPTQQPFNPRAFGPIAAYVGSGLSYESGLPTLATVHETFGVDRLGDEEFTFAAKDPLPQQLADSVSTTFARFVQFHVLAAAAAPSKSHEKLAALYHRGIVTRILTDNVDNMFSKIDVPFTRTRGIGIFNDRFEIRFDKGEKTLLVIGVAADRRSIIEQARRQGLHIVVVNPQERVSPKSQNLSYLRLKDYWYRMTAQEFFKHFIND